MSKNKTPAPGGNRERVETEEHRAGAVSTAHDTTHSGTIASILCVGKENALTGREIRRVLGLKDGRDVTALVEQERHSGIPICATCNSKRPGYYLPQTPGELDTYNRSLRRRIKNVTATLEAMQRAADDWSGQQRLDLTDGEGADNGNC